jgi:catechol 2,3-dioxygenase-like lactoylglutathione lyase family enzyme
MSALAPLITGVDFVYIFTQDFQAAAEFYGTTLGLERSATYRRVAGAEFEAGNLTLVVVDAEAYGGDFQPNTNPIALHVEDFEAACAQLERRGISFKHTLDSGVCRMAFFNDPDGNALMLHHRYSGG